MPIYFPEYPLHVDIDAVNWEGSMQLPTFWLSSARWLMAKGRNLEFITSNHLLPKWVFRPYCRYIMICHPRKKGKFVLTCEDAVDVIYVRKIFKEILFLDLIFLSHNLTFFKIFSIYALLTTYWVFAFCISVILTNNIWCYSPVSHFH